MPLCNRKCTECQHEEEDLVEFGKKFDRKRIECPVCHKETFEKPDYMPIGYCRMEQSELFKQYERGE